MQELVVFVLFETCDSEGSSIANQHPHVYVNPKHIKRILKHADDISFIDFGPTGMFVRGDYNAIADQLNAPKQNPVEVLWPNLEEA